MSAASIDGGGADSDIVALLDGIPLYMLKKARVVTGSRDPAVWRTFVLANLDQDDEFWVTEGRIKALQRERSATILQDTVQKLGRAPEDVLRALGVKADQVLTAATKLGLSRTVSAPPASASPGLSSQHRDSFHRQDPSLVPVPEDNDDDLLQQERTSPAKSRWRRARVLLSAASALSSTVLGNRGPGVTPFGPLAESITENPAMRSILDAKHQDMAAAVLQDGPSSKWLQQLDENDRVQVRLKPKVPGDEEVWAPALVQHVLSTENSVHEVSVVVNPAELPEGCSWHDSSTTEMIVTYTTRLSSSTSSRRPEQKRRHLRFAASGQSEWLPSEMKWTPGLIDDVRPPLADGSGCEHRGYGKLHVTDMKVGETVEVCVLLHHYAKVGNPSAPVYVPWGPSTPGSHWCQATVTGIDRWIGGASLVQLSLPQDFEKASENNRLITQGPGLLLWNLYPNAKLGHVQELLNAMIGGILKEQEAAGSPSVVRTPLTTFVATCRLLKRIGCDEVGAHITLTVQEDDVMDSLLSKLNGLEHADVSGSQAIFIKPGGLGATRLRNTEIVWRPCGSANAGDDADGPQGPSFDASETDTSFAFTKKGVARVSIDPSRPGFSVYVCTEAAPKNIRCAASAQVAATNPEGMVGCRANIRKANAWTRGDIIAYVPRMRRHVFMACDNSTQNVMLVNLGEPTYVLEPVKPWVLMHEPDVLAKMGTHLKCCIVCFEPLEAEAWAEFCYETYHVDGHTVDVRGPRHPRKVCKQCLKRHCEAGLNEGRLYVQCPVPACGRALQVRELEDIVDVELYSKLMERLREAEEQEQLNDTEINAAGLELRLCPQCRVRIEKNEGCSTMRCYRCGHSFTWHEADKIEPQLPAGMFAGESAGDGREEDSESPDAPSTSSRGGSMSVDGQSDAAGAVGPPAGSESTFGAFGGLAGASQPSAAASSMGGFGSGFGGAGFGGSTGSMTGFGGGTGLGAGASFGGATGAGGGAGFGEGTGFGGGGGGGFGLMPESNPAEMSHTSRFGWYQSAGTGTRWEGPRRGPRSRHARGGGGVGGGNPNTLSPILSPAASPSSPASPALDPQAAPNEAVPPAPDWSTLAAQSTATAVEIPPHLQRIETSDL